VAEIGGSSNAAIAFDFLIGKGLTCEQAAGVVGNLQVESPGVDPTRSVMDTNNKMSRGIAMWQPDRWQRLLDFASGRDPLSLDTQLEFLWHELESDPSLGLASLRASTTVGDATVAFQNRFERPLAAKAHTDRRIAAAQAAIYACPAVVPPPRKSPVAATVGVLTLVAAVGYGIYKAMSWRAPEPPEPIPPPWRPPVYRPAPRPPWQP